jgi:hypothetical protein
LRDQLLEYFQPLRGKGGHKIAEPRQVGAGPREAIDEPGANRITDQRHDDWNRACSVLERPGGRRAAGDYDIDAESGEFGREAWNWLGLILGPSPFDDDVFPFYVAKMAKLLRKKPLRIANPAGVPARRTPIRRVFDCGWANNARGARG